MTNKKPETSIVNNRSHVYTNMDEAYEIHTLANFIFTLLIFCQAFSVRHIAIESTFDKSIITQLEAHLIRI